MKKKVQDITTQILISIRDEITGLRQDNVSIRDEIVGLRKDIGVLQQDMSAMKQDMASVKQDMKAVAAHFDRDYLLLANDVGNLKGRVTACEKALKLAS